MAKKSKNKAAMNMGGRGWAMVIGIVFLLVLVGMACWMWRGYRVVGICSSENLQLTAGQQSGAAGTIYQHMALTNTGKRPCSMSGFPTAFLYGSDGYALGSGAAARPQPAPVAMTLAPGETASTSLGYPQAGNFPPGNCSAAKSTSLKLYPPSNTAPLETPLEVNWCPGFSETAMQAGN